MRNITLNTLLAASLAFGSALAFANDPEPTPLDPTPVADAKPSFETLDTNKDGQVAKAEIPVDHELNTLFASFDADANQSLSRGEFDEYATEEEEEAE